MQHSNGIVFNGVLDGWKQRVLVTLHMGSIFKNCCLYFFDLGLFLTDLNLTLNLRIILGHHHRDHTFLKSKFHIKVLSRLLLGKEEYFEDNAQLYTEIFCFSLYGWKSDWKTSLSPVASKTSAALAKKRSDSAPVASKTRAALAKKRPNSAQPSPASVAEKTRSALTPVASKTRAALAKKRPNSAQPSPVPVAKKTRSNAALGPKLRSVGKRGFFVANIPTCTYSFSCNPRILNFKQLFFLCDDRKAVKKAVATVSKQSTPIPQKTRCNTRFRYMPKDRWVSHKLPVNSKIIFDGDQVEWCHVIMTLNWILKKKD